VNPDELLAIHEAGHAVIAELLCLNPDYVTIEPTDRADGHLKRRTPAYSAWERWRLLLVICAGVLAEEICPAVDEPSEDLESPGDEGADSARLWASLQMHSDNPGQRHEWFVLASAQTRRILSNPAVWRSVESLAARLLEKRTIDRWESAGAIDAALGGSKWKRERDRRQMVARYASPPLTWIESREEYRRMEKAMAAYAAGVAAK
jgi:hypothetical protein